MGPGTTPGSEDFHLSDDHDHRTPLGRLIDRLVELSDEARADRPEDAAILAFTAETLDAYRILHGDMTAKANDVFGVIMPSTRTLPRRPAGPVPNRRRRRAIYVPRD
jgi:hypothetical protein